MSEPVDTSAVRRFMVRLVDYGSDADRSGSGVVYTREVRASLVPPKEPPHD